MPDDGNGSAQLVGSFANRHFLRKIYPNPYRNWLANRNKKIPFEKVKIDSDSFANRLILFDYKTIYPENTYSQGRLQFCATAGLH